MAATHQSGAGEPHALFTSTPPANILLSNRHDNVIMPSTLTKWPTELRLVMYSHLITSCLHDGRASDLAGAFLCCRTIYHDIQNEYMGTLAPLLLAKHSGRHVLSLPWLRSISRLRQVCAVSHGRQSYASLYHCTPHQRIPS
jgi:hypothetical protein